MKREHHYDILIKWTGNTGNGTSNYRDYKRDHSILSANKTEVFCSSDPAFRGDKTKYNPEELLVASISSCHMLWFLHLCAEEGVNVVDYKDNATGTMNELENGSGVFSVVTLHPVVTVTDTSMIAKANNLHQTAHKMCFIANSVNFPILHQPQTIVQ